MPRACQETVSFFPDVWSAGASGTCVLFCLALGLLDLTTLCATFGLRYLFGSGLHFSVYNQNKDILARVLGSFASAWAQPRTLVGPRLPTSLFQATASARCAPPLSVADLGRHGLASLRLY